MSVCTCRYGISLLVFLLVNAVRRQVEHWREMSYLHAPMYYPLCNTLSSKLTDNHVTFT